MRCKYPPWRKVRPIPSLGVSIFLLALLAPAAEGARIVHKSISVTVLSQSEVRKQTRLQVRLLTAEDVRTWSAHEIRLGENRTLKKARGLAVLPDGTRIEAVGRDRDDRPGSGAIVRRSERAHVLDFAGLTVGSRIEIDYTIDLSPYYPTGRIALADRDPIDRLEVTVKCREPFWRWRLDGPADGIEVEETEDGVIVTARRLRAPEPPEMAPRGSAVQPILRYGWGKEGSWREVGSWYSDLLREVPLGSYPVRLEARELIAGLDEPRQRLEALLAFMRREIGYLAVVAGIGSYRPSPPEDVLARRWGDCKEKALLFIDLLFEAGVEAYPALVLSDSHRRVDVEFPSPDELNHVLVAVPATAVHVSADDPVEDGYLFVDPTQDRGTGSWLHPLDQDHVALLVRDGAGSLIRTPLRPGQERRKLVVYLRMTPDGGAVGGASLELTGKRAAGVFRKAEPDEQDKTADSKSVFFSLLPGVSILHAGWSEDERAGAPGVTLAGGVGFEKLVTEGNGLGRSLGIPGLPTMPEPDLLEDRQTPLLATPQSTEVTWHLALPRGWCLPEARTERVESALGVFVESVSVDPARNMFTVERKAELRRRWIEPESFPDLRKLALAERRAHRRQIFLKRGSCG